MKYCTKCVMPSTRPGITFDENGVCSACQSYEKDVYKRQGILWGFLQKPLEFGWKRMPV